MLPDVEGEQRFQAFGDGVAGVGFLGDDQGAVFLCRKPDPAGAEQTRALGFELGLEGVNTSPLLLDLGFDLAHRFRAFRDELREVEVVVEHLTGIVEDGAGGFLHDLLEGHVLVFAPREELIEVVHVGLEVFAVVERERLGADDGFQGGGGVG